MGALLWLWTVQDPLLLWQGFSECGLCMSSGAHDGEGSRRPLEELLLKLTVVVVFDVH